MEFFEATFLVYCDGHSPFRSLPLGLFWPSPSTPSVPLLVLSISLASNIPSSYPFFDIGVLISDSCLNNIKTAQYLFVYLNIITKSPQNLHYSL